MRLTFLAIALVIAQQTFFSEVMEVRITNVDVIVTGKDGKPITGLTKDDFVVTEDGVQKEISNFLEINEGPGASLTNSAEATATPGGAAPQDLRRRHITVFIDNAVLHPSRRHVILSHLNTFLEKNVRAGDQVMIASWGKSLKLELEPTSDRSAIEATIKRLDQPTTFGFEEYQEKERYQRALIDLINEYALREPPQKPPMAFGIGRAGDYATWATHNSRQRVEAVKSLMASLRGATGRKVLVLVTQNLTMNPGEWAFAHLDSMRDFFVGDLTSVMVEGRRYEIQGLVSDISEAANSTGITLYPIDGAGKESGLNIPDASINVRNVARPTVGVSAMPTLSEIAAETGGVALTGSTNWQLAFDTIANDLNTYYSLGYRSTGERQDRLKRIEVKLKNKRYAVRTRRGIIERTVTSEMRDAVAANLFRAVGTNDLDIRAAAGTSAPKTEDSFTVPLTITIPLEKLTLLPEGKDLTGGFAIYAAFLRKDGAVSKVAQQPQSFRFPADSLKRRKEITVKLDVTADSRTGGISVGVMDQASRVTGFASVKLAE